METHRHTKDWLANLASSTQLCKKNMRKNQPWRCLCFGSALQITRMTPSRLTILQLRRVKMKVRASVKKLCRNCKIVKRDGVIRVI